MGGTSDFGGNRSATMAPSTTAKRPTTTQSRDAVKSTSKSQMAIMNSIIKQYNPNLINQ
jgi:hypothetical protein